GEDHDYTLRAGRIVLETHVKAGRANEMIPLGEETLRRSHAKYGPLAALTNIHAAKLMDAYIAAGRDADFAALVDACTSAIKAQPNRGDSYLSTMKPLSRLNSSAGRHLEAAAIL